MKYMLNNAVYDSSIHVIPDGAEEISDELYNKFSDKLSEWHKWTGSDWEVDTTKKQQVIARLKNQIDAETDTAIRDGFEYLGMTFTLSLENQINYKAEYDIRERLTYPHKVKHNDGYLTLNSADDYQAFYLAGVQYIRTQIVSGWNRKDELQSKTTTELIDITGGQA